MGNRWSVSDDSSRSNCWSAKLGDTANVVVYAHLFGPLLYMSLAPMTSYLEALAFEKRVAAIYRALGADVTLDVAVAGNQVDLLVDERTKSGTNIRTVVECKATSRPVGVSTVNAFTAILNLLTTRDLCQRGVIVSLAGFTKAARVAADEHHVGLVDMADLEARVKDEGAAVQSAVNELGLQQQVSWTIGPKPKQAFVIMPFSTEYNDIYVLGIREVAEQLGIVARRADEIQHNDSIPDTIRELIEQADVVIAETSDCNPNVMYEVGLAHGVKKPTILICTSAEDIPFDLAAVNHIIYCGIVELREKLKQRLSATLAETSDSLD